MLLVASETLAHARNLQRILWRMANELDNGQLQQWTASAELFNILKHAKITFERSAPHPYTAQAVTVIARACFAEVITKMSPTNRASGCIIIINTTFHAWPYATSQSMLMLHALVD